MMKLALVFVAALALGVDGQTPSYAALCPTHTMVIYPTVGAACGTPPVPFAVSPAEITTILDKHNALRRRIALGNEILGAPGPQPGAANMRHLTWDAELATVAQRWASQCLPDHDACRKVARFSNVGQNGATKKSGTYGLPAPWTWSIDSWYNEVSLFDKSIVYPFVFAKKTGHYTQVVWAETYLVGCGYAYYNSTLATDVKNPYVQITVCNYGPQGNFNAQAMYKIGAPCSQCPAGTVCIDNLCK